MRNRARRAAMSGYREFAPDARIADHVHCLWSYEGIETGTEQAEPPDGRCELVIHRGTPYEERGAGEDGHRWHRQPAALFAGQLTRPLLLRAHGAVSVLGVRVRTGGAWAYVGRPLASFTDARVDLSVSQGADETARLGTALDTAADDGQRWPIGRCTSSIASRATTAGATRRSTAASRLDREARVTNAEMTSLTGLAPRRLQRRVAEGVGISPRQLAAIVRLRRVFDVLRDEPFASWSESAHAAGFFDHPQMSRDFRRFVGKSPSAWKAAGPGIAASLAGWDADPSQTYKTGA